MFTSNANSCPIIVIDDSTDEEETIQKSISEIAIHRQPKRTSTDASTSKQRNTILPKKPPLSNSHPKSSKQTPLPSKKLMNQRKSVHQTIRQEDNPTFKIIIRKRGDSGEDDSYVEKKLRWKERQLDEAVDQTLDDPETNRLLKRIAYYRVLTNHLLKKFDLLCIDFKLYSNLDLLNLDLQMQLDTYKSKHKNRQLVMSRLQVAQAE